MLKVKLLLINRALQSITKIFSGWKDQVKTKSIGHIRILGIGLELACNAGEYN